MSEHRLGRKEMRQPDAFQTTVQGFFDRLQPYLRTIGIVATLAGFAGAAFWAWQLRSEKNTELLNIEFAAAVEDYEKNFQAGMVKNEVHWQDTMAMLDALYGKSAGTELQPFVLQYIANTYIEMRNYDAALGSLTDLERLVKDNPEAKVLALYSKAKALELKGDQGGAAAAYNEAAGVTPNPLGEFLEAEAKRANAPLLSKATVDQYLSAMKPVTAAADASK